jgi:REP element-mobilizing transposase RayT
MRHRHFVHLVWATRDRAPVLTRSAAVFLATYLSRVAQGERAVLLEFGAVRTHVHLLVRLHPLVCVSRIVQRFKGGSAFHGRTEHGLTIRWHAGYSVDSVNWRSLPDVAAYVAAQPRRHPAEAILGWPDDPKSAEQRARQRAAHFLDLLRKERYATLRRAPNGGS